MEQARTQNSTYLYGILTPQVDGEFATPPCSPPTNQASAILHVLFDHPVTTPARDCWNLCVPLYLVAVIVS